MPIAESVAVQGLQWLASPIVSRLINHGFSYVGMDVPKELTELETILLPKISLFIKALPRSSANSIPELKPWLQRLQDAYYEAEDLLDEAEYLRVAKLVKQERRKLLVRVSSYLVIKPLTKFSHKVSKKLSFMSPQKRKFWRRLTNFRDNVKKLIEDAQIFHGFLQNLPSIASRNANTHIVPDTSSLPLNKVFGRDEDRDHVVKLLMEERVGEGSKQRYSVVAVVGRGGAGKTTLAQYVFNDERVVKYFDTRIWVCLKRKLDFIEHTKEMIQSAAKRESPQQSNLDALQYDLRKILLASKNILVVLDDVWYNKNESQIEESWERLMAPFNSIGKCKVLLTSRSAELPVALEARNLIRLRDLEKHEVISLFRHYSNLDEICSSNLQIQQELEAIGVKIVEKLGRSPLATKSVASQLRNQRDANVWRRILEIADFKDSRDALMWSFQQLEEPLQRCFLYCAVFPRGIKLSKVLIVTHWCALNLILSADTRRPIEEIGGEYFDMLLASFFLQPITNSTSHELAYTIHDNFYDLAENLSRDDCFKIENDQVIKIPLTVRHLSISIGNIEQHITNICKLENLRSLLFFAPIIAEDSSTKMNKIFGILKKLRVLEFYGGIPYATYLPEVIGTLNFVKVLNIGFCSSIKQLPESLSNLYNLRELGIPEVLSLPRNMSNLINLQNVCCIGEDNQFVTRVPPIRNIGKMSSLHFLPEFHVKKEKGFEIQQLGQLRQLQGHLTIRGLENIQHEAEGAQAKLAEKMGLESLELVWTSAGWGVIREIDLEVINALQPPSNLKKLIIRKYAGAKYPEWFANTLVIQNLSSIHLYWCTALELLPSNFHSWRNCYELVLGGNMALKALPHLPENLNALTISLSPSLVFLSEEDLHSNQQSVLLNEQFVVSMIASCIECSNPDVFFINIHDDEWISFKQISINMKREYSEHMQVLERSLGGNMFSFGIDQLKAWWNCHTQRMNFIYSSAIQENRIKYLTNLRFLNLTSCNITNGGLSECLSGLNSLEELHLQSIMSLTTLPSEDILGNLKCLRIIRIYGCWLLRSLGGLYAFFSLEKLDVRFCPCLDLKKENNPNFGLPSSLQSLVISLCSISSDILKCNLPCLSTVDFRNCRSPPSLSIGHLTSLRSLQLFNCRDICFLEGLQLLCNLEDLRLTRVPKLEVNKSVLESWPGCRERLDINNMQLLKILFSLDAFVVPRQLHLEYIEEEAITFDSEFESEGSVLYQNFASVKYLDFYKCKTKSLPTSLRSVFSSLENIVFVDCPELSSLPELPESLTEIEITGCPVLKEKCRYNGEDWPKIAHIRWKIIA